MIKVILLVLLLFMIAGCDDLNPEPTTLTHTKSESQEIARDFLLNNNNYVSAQGFDIEFIDDKKLPECASCWRFMMKYSVLSAELGYEVEIDVKEGEPSLHIGPNPLS